MTENESILSTLQNGIVCATDDITREDLEMMVKCLEELQQYRAIGTVEDLKTMKENGAFTGVELAQILAMQMELKKYQSIGTIEEFKALKEKSVAKKPLHNGANWYRCPNGCEVHKKTFEKDWYCPDCGQRLDWSE